MKKLVLIGGGGHCKSVLDTAVRTNFFSEIVITDCETPAGSNLLGYKISGTDHILPELYREGFTDAFVTMGSIKDTNKRRKAYEKAIKCGYHFPVLVDPSAVVSVSARVGNGAFVGKNAVVNADTDIGGMAIINTGAFIEHDCVIGEFTHIAVGAIVCGSVKVGNDVFIGAGSTIIQGVKIGRKCIIGAGSVVLADVPDGSTVWGRWRGI